MFVLTFVDKPHYIFDACPVVPTSVEDDDFARGGIVRNVALNIHLAFFTIAWRWQSNNAENARTDTLCDRFDCSALAGRVTAFKYDDDFRPFGLHPILQPTQLDLKLVQMLFIFLALHLLGIRIVSRHASHPMHASGMINL